MNWAEFKDPLPQMYLAGDVVAFWSLTQEVAGSSSVMTNLLNSVKHLGKTPLSSHRRPKNCVLYNLNALFLRSDEVLL